jgi:Zn-dependent metalloprotease/subtilisin-like proprotein convertase family protein
MSLRRVVDLRAVLFAALAGGAACSSGAPGGSTPPVDTTPAFEPVRITEKNEAPVASDDIERAAIDYVRTYDADLRLGPNDDFSVKSAKLGNDKLTHVRLQQTYQGIPVWGADVVVHASSVQFRGLNGALAVNLPNIDLDPAIAANEALSIGKGLYANQGKSGPATGLDYSREATRLVILPRRGRDAALAWHVEFFTELQAGIGPGLWNFMIDAQTGDVLDSWNAVHGLSQASGPGGNPKVTRTWVEELDVEPSGDQFMSETARLVTTDMNNSTSGSGTVVVGPLDNFGDAPINDAHGFAEATLNMMLEWYGYTSIDNAGFVIRSRVHYGTNYENAFWDGTQMTYGDGASFFYPLSGDVDVVSHEISHGFTTFHSGLIYSQQSGGMNEAFSDIAGTIAEHYVEGAGADWDLGTDIFQSDGALRYMCDPTADGVSIDHFDDYYDGLDVHYSSGIANLAFCRSARRLASGDPNGESTPESVRRVGEAFYAANESYWTSSSTFAQSCQGILDAGAALGFTEAELEAINLSWQDVGVFCDGTNPPIQCDETLTAESGTITSPNYPNPYGNNYDNTWCIEPASGNPATLTFTAFNTEAGYDFVQIRDANGDEVSNTSGTTAPAPSTSTLLAVRFRTDGSVVATGWSASWSTDGTNNQPPTVSIDSPADGATVSGDVLIAASAADADGTVARVVFDLPDGSSVEDDSAPYEVAWDSTVVADGSYGIGATAFDDMGSSSPTASISVTVENGTSCAGGTYEATDVPREIPDNNTTGIRSIINVEGAGNVGSLSLSLNITHTWRGDLKVILVSPSGTRYVAHNRAGSSADDVVISDLSLAVFDGEPVGGNWRLRVQDHAGYDVGTLNSWSLAITGDCSGGGGTWSASGDPNLPTVDNGEVCTSLTVTGKGEASAAKLDISGEHAWRSILRGTLTHNGTTVDAFPVDTFPSDAGTFEFTDRAVAGLSGSAEGEWTLCIIDTDAFGDTGVLAHWAIHD